MGKKRISNKLIEKIKSLRNQGYSLPEISKTTGVAKTTVFRYIKDVEILPENINNWMGKRGGSKKRKLVREQKAFEEASKIFDKLSYREKLLFLSALYWGEGSKKDFGLSNTDPGLIKVFVTGLREVFNIDENRLRISVRIYEDLDRKKCLSFWSKIVGIPEEKFINVNVLSGRKKGKLEYGMCRVRVAKGGDVLKKINGINKVVKNLFVPIA